MEKFFKISGVFSTLFFALFLYEAQFANAADFGKTTVGATSENISADNKRFTRFISPSDIDAIDSISAYLNRTGTGAGYAVRGGIYTDNSGAPESLVANSDIVIDSNIARNSPQWYTVTYSTKPTLNPDTVYWIGIQAAKASLTYYDAGATNQTYTKADAYSDGLDASWGTAGTGTAKEHSFYISYTPAAQNNQPSLSEISDSPDPVAPGDTATFNAAWADADSGELVKLHVCKTNTVQNPTSGGNCESGQTWFDSESFTGTNPQIGTYVASSTDIGIQNYYIFVCDDSGADNSCSSSLSGTFAVNGSPTILSASDAPDPAVFAIFSKDIAFEKINGRPVEGTTFIDILTKTLPVSGRRIEINSSGRIDIKRL